VHRAMSKKQAQRFETPTDMRSALEPFRTPAIRLSVPTRTGPQAGLWTGQAAAPVAQSASHSTAVESERNVAGPDARPIAAATRPPRWMLRSLVALACLAVVSLTVMAAGVLAFGHGDAGFEPTPSPVPAEATVGATPPPVSVNGGTPTVRPTP